MSRKAARRGDTSLVALHDALVALRRAWLVTEPWPRTFIVLAIKDLLSIDALQRDRAVTLQVLKRDFPAARLPVFLDELFPMPWKKKAAPTQKKEP